MRLSVVCILTTAICVVKSAYDERQITAVRNVFTHIFKLEPPTEGEPVLKPPKHMMELYKKYALIGNTRFTVGNTVRSILPTLQAGSTEDTAMLVFNVTCISTEEQTNLAQIHLHRRRLTRDKTSWASTRVLEPPYRVRLYQLTRHRTRSLASLPIIQNNRGGWYSLDITQALRELLLDTSSGLSLRLGLRFEAPRNKPIALDRFLKTSADTSAFLIVFTDSKVNDNLLVEQSRGENVSLKDGGGQGKVSKRIYPKSKYRVHVRSNDHEDLLISRGRMIRSIIDNELPEERRRSGEALLKTTPGRLLRGSTRRRRGKGKKRKKNWKQEVKWAPVEVGSCHRAKLVVDFSDIGWSNWIISPPRFEAHYCTGHCAYPLTKRLKPTNHATIQSLVHAIGQESRVPDPCCVPDKLSPLSLLYLDENSNVVLRSYDQMTVDSCACR